MSRIGKSPIPIPAGVSVSILPGRVMVNGPLGELTQRLPQRIQVEEDDGQLLVKRPTERGEDRALHGLTRSLVANMVEGVTKGFSKTLEIQGVGYRASMRGSDLELNVGFSHSIVKKAPQGITFEVPAPNQTQLKKTFKGTKTEQAAEVGKLLAAAARKAGVESVVFDRGGYLYHGRVKALADGAREGGLKF